MLFELGARWGAGLPMIPLVAGVEPGDLQGPLRGLNALISNSESQLHQMVENLAKTLKCQLQSPASYSRYVAALVRLSSNPTVTK